MTRFEDNPAEGDDIFYTATHMANPDYTVLVRRYLFGQFHIQLTDKRKPDEYAPEGHGSIVREMCTYKPSVALIAASRIIGADDPEAFCRSLERPYNCEHEGGRIRLDNKPEEDVT